MQFFTITFFFFWCLHLYLCVRVEPHQHWKTHFSIPGGLYSATGSWSHYGEVVVHIGTKALGLRFSDSQCFGHAINGSIFLAGDWIASIYYSCHMSCQVRLHRLWQRVHALSVTQLHAKMSRAQQWVLLWVFHSSGGLNVLNSIHQCRHHESIANLLNAQGWCLRHCMDEPFSFYCWTCPLRHHEIDWWLASLSCSWSCQTIKSPGVERMGERLKACRTLARSLGFSGGNEWATDWSRCICVQ